MIVAELIEELRKYPPEMFALISDGRDIRHMISHLELSEFGPLIIPRVKFMQSPPEIVDATISKDGEISITFDV